MILVILFYDIFIYIISEGGKLDAMSYIYCPKSKAQNKKHITICKQCQHRKSCLEYLSYLQPELPLKS